MTEATTTPAEPKDASRRELVDFYATHPQTYIVCQRCLSRSAAELEADTGCSTCGGYLHTTVRLKCGARCGQKYWTRPGCRTVFAGKEYTSIDGVDLVWDEKRGSVCEKCYRA